MLLLGGWFSPTAHVVPSTVLASNRIENTWNRSSWFTRHQPGQLALTSWMGQKSAMEKLPPTFGDPWKYYNTPTGKLTCTIRWVCVHAFTPFGHACIYLRAHNIEGLSECQLHQVCMHMSMCVQVCVHVCATCPERACVRAPTWYSGSTLWKSMRLQRETASWSAVQLSLMGSLSCRTLQKGARGLLLWKPTVLVNPCLAS